MKRQRFYSFCQNIYTKGMLCLIALISLVLYLVGADKETAVIVALVLTIKAVVVNRFMFYVYKNKPHRFSPAD